MKRWETVTLSPGTTSDAKQLDSAEDQGRAQGQTFTGLI